MRNPDQQLALVGDGVNINERHLLIHTHGAVLSTGPFSGALSNHFVSAFDPGSDTESFTDQLFCLGDLEVTKIVPCDLRKSFVEPYSLIHQGSDPTYMRLENFHLYLLSTFNYSIKQK